MASRTTLLERMLFVVLVLSTASVAAVTVSRELRIRSEEGGGLGAVRVAPELWHQMVRGGAVLGRPNGEQEVVFFVDYECPACRVSHEAVLKPLIDGDGPATPISVVVRNWPLPYHGRAKEAARVAYCAAEQGALLPTMTALYRLQDPEHSESSPLDLAREVVELQHDRLQECADGRDAHAAVEADIQLAMSATAPGTPAIFVRGELVGANTSAAVRAALGR